MPHFRLETNVPQSKIPKDFAKKLCELTANTLGKPLSYCAATVIGDVHMVFAGTDEPTGQATLTSIGRLGVEENKKHSKAFAELISKEIGVPNDRMYIIFNDAESKDVGYTGTTFHQIFGH